MIGDKGLLAKRRFTADPTLYPPPPKPESRRHAPQHPPLTLRESFCAPSKPLPPIVLNLAPRAYLGESEGFGAGSEQKPTTTTKGDKRPALVLRQRGYLLHCDSRRYGDGLNSRTAKELPFAEAMYLHAIQPHSCIHNGLLSLVRMHPKAHLRTDFESCRMLLPLSRSTADHCHHGEARQADHVSRRWPDSQKTPSESKSPNRAKEVDDARFAYIKRAKKNSIKLPTLHPHFSTHIKRPLNATHPPSTLICPTCPTAPSCRTQRPCCPSNSPAR